MKKYDNTNMVLRYLLGFENTEKRFENLVEFLTKTGIHRVILFTAPFVETSSILPIDYYKRHSQMLAPYIKKLRELNIEVGINSLYTVGHCYYADEDEFGFKRAVTVNGEASRGCVCMHADGFDEYLREEYRCYAELKPSYIFLDDDIRTISLGQIVCLCDEHVKLISDRVGKTLTREEIKNAIFSDELELNPIKKAFFEQTKEDVNHIISVVTDAIRSVSPDTKIGIMTVYYPDMTLDRNLNEFFGEFYDKGVTAIRTGMQFYREGEHKNIPLCFSMPAIQRNFIDDERVEIQPEIENDIYGFFYKSNSVTEMQVIWCLTNGFRNMELNLFDSLDAHPDNFKDITDSFVKNSALYNKIDELIPVGHRSEGVNIFASPDSLLHRRAKNGRIMFDANWHKYLCLDGIPVGYKKDSDWNMFIGDDIAALSDEQIDLLLKKGAVIDLRAAENLLYRGFGERIGVKSIEDIQDDYCGERFSTHRLNGEYVGLHNSHYSYNSLIDNTLIKKISYYDNAEALSYIIDHNKNKLCNGVTVFENSNSERFCIMPTDADNDFSQFTNVGNKRKYQLINVFEWIAGKNLPIFTYNPLMCVNINRFENYNVISLFNISSDEIEHPEIAYTPIGNLSYIDSYGNLEPLEYTSCGRKLTLNKAVKALGTVIIVDKKGE